MVTMQRLLRSPHLNYLAYDTRRYWQQAFSRIRSLGAGVASSLQVGSGSRWDLRAPRLSRCVQTPHIVDSTTLDILRRTCRLATMMYITACSLPQLPELISMVSLP